MSSRRSQYQALPDSDDVSLQDESDSNFINKWKHKLYKNRRIIIVIVGSITLLMVAFTVLLVSIPRPSIKKDPRHKLTIEAISNETFQPHFVSFYWDNKEDSNNYWLINGTDLVEIDPIDEVEVRSIIPLNLLEAERGRNFDLFSIKQLPKSNIIALPYNKDGILKHSQVSSYALFDIESQTFLDTKDDLLEVNNLVTANKHDYIAVVKKNNICVFLDKNLETKITVTNTESENVLNGSTDWIYDEEVFQSEKGTQWSRDDSYIAFINIDDTNVPDFELTYYTIDTESETKTLKIKKPLVGEKNPVATLNVFDISSQKLIEFKEINESEQVFLDEPIIQSFNWLDDHRLLVKQLNRFSNIMFVYILDARSKLKTFVRTVHGSEGYPGWIETPSNILSICDSENSDGYVDVIPNGNYYHIALFEPSAAEHPIFLTSGQWEVTGLFTYDPKRREIIFQRTSDDSPMQRLIATVNIDTKEINYFDERHGPGYYTASISPAKDFAYVAYRGPNVPKLYLQNLHEEKRSKNIDIELNKHTTRALQKYAMPTIRHFSTILPSGATVNVKEILPASFRPGSKRRYPVIFNPYGGPSSQQTSEIFEVGINDVLATDFIIVIADGSGTGYNGISNRRKVYESLGKHESEDQIALAQEYGKLPYVDSTRMAIWGWSYGGYLTLKTLEKDAGRTFQYGIAVAPVVDWGLYDSIYTERYMLRQHDNQVGYNEARISNMTALAQLERFAIIHGTADDNVQLKNSMILIEKANLAELQNVDVKLFPDSNHSINHANSRKVLYHWMQKWFEAQMLQ